VVSRAVMELLEQEAKKRGVSVEEYILDLMSERADPESCALRYAEVAEGLLEEALEELGRGDVRGAAEKTWEATALAVKAYAYWRERRRLASHGEMWEYKDRMAHELGEWIREAWLAANAMHICFCEGWCTKADVEVAYKYVKRLVEEVRERIAHKPKT